MRLGFDLDEQARVDERFDDDQRRGRPDLAEDLAVDRDDLGRDATSVTNIRVRTTSSKANPPSARARPMISSVARAWAAASPGGVETPSGPRSVVPATQHESPMTTARL